MSTRAGHARAAAAAQASEASHKGTTTSWSPDNNNNSNTNNAEHVTCVVCLDGFDPSHGVSCGAPTPHFLCGDAGGAGCLGGHVRARAGTLRATDLLARPPRVFESSKNENIGNVSRVGNALVHGGWAKASLAPPHTR